MSPPSSNDPRSPNGPPEWLRHGRTALELDVVGADEPRSQPDAAQRGRAEERRAAEFGNVPMVTQPFPPFTDLRDSVPQADSAPPRSRAEELRGPTQPLPQAPNRPELAASKAAPPVAVARVHEIGQRAEPMPTPAPSAAPRDLFTRTAIAAGHRVPSPIPEARAPVPAYPSQPYAERHSGVRTPVTPQAAQSCSSQSYEDPRSAVRTPTPSEPEPPAQLPASLGEVARSESPRTPDQFAQTTCSDVHGLLGKHPVPLPELGGSPGSPVAWSRLRTDSGKPTPEPALAARVERPVAEPKREARARRQMDDDELELHRVLSGASMKKRIALSLAVVLVSGLLGLSVYVKRSRSAEAELALANAPEAVVSAPEPVVSAPEPVVHAPEPVVHADAVGAPSEAAQHEETPRVASNRKQPKHAQEPAVAQASEPAAPASEPDAPVSDAAGHSAKGSVTASSAAALYVNGQYKEALAEYQLLARAYPKQRVYTELARILHRKLIETCMRTQPNRREQCKTM